MSNTEAFAALAAGKPFDPARNQQWRIARRPVGNVVPEDFAFHEVDVPEPGPGEALIRIHYLGLAPVMRMYMQGTDRTGDPPQSLGDVIRGRGVGQIIKSRHPDWREGAMVQGRMGWQTWALSRFLPEDRMFRMPRNGLPAALGAGVLGMTGLSAYAGLFPTADARAGDRFVLSGAAGGVGTMVAQIAARVLDCEVIGIAGGAEKCGFIRQLGCIEAIDYKNEDVVSRLDALLPDGIDVYFDNVGGEILSACLERLRMQARIVLCGSISEYARPEPFGLTNYTRLRGKDARMAGFFVYNHLPRWSEAMEALAGWIADGRLRPVQDVTEGFAHMPAALANLYHGRNIGVQCCSVRGEPEDWL
jgi:NADPH-dependent curcumin reductase CurA